MSPAEEMAVGPRTPTEWAAWSRSIAVQLQLSAGEAHVLAVIAGHADRDGTCYPSVARIAAQARRSASQVYRLLNALVRRGLVRSRQQGPGRPALRELVAVPVDRAGEQLSLFDQPVTAPAKPRRRAAHAPAAAAAGRRDLASSRMGATKPSHRCDPEEPEEEQLTEEGGTRASAPPARTSPDLPEVLEVLAQAAGVTVDEPAVNAVLCRYPGGDGPAAARDVLMWADRGGLRCTSGDRLLLAALRKRRDRAEHRTARPAAAAPSARQARLERRTRSAAAIEAVHGPNPLSDLLTGRGTASVVRLGGAWL